MGEQPRIKPLDLRKAVPEWAAQGLSVKIGPDGTVEVRSDAVKSATDADTIDWRRR